MGNDLPDIADVVFLVKLFVGFGVGGDEAKGTAVEG
jgi:hypothetical protein